MSGELKRLPDWLEPYREAYEGYLDMRSKKKWVLTPRAEKRLLGKLWDALEGHYDVEFMLDEANEKNWKSVFVNEHTPKLRQAAAVEPISDHLFEVYKRDRERSERRKVG